MEYDGTNWTTGGSLNTGRDNITGVGTQTGTIAFGGQEPTTSAKTEEYNGTAWTEVADLAVARYSLMPAGTSNLAAIAAGGSDNPTNTEEWNIPDAIKTFTSS